MRIKYQYLYRDITNAYALLPRLSGGRWALPPIQMLFELTYRCNQRCSVCQFLPLLKSGDFHARGEELSTAEVKHIVAQMPPISLITFTGGEPLLRSDLEELVAYTGRKHLVQVISNAGLLSPERASELCKYGSQGMFVPGLFSFGVSVQGYGETHNQAVGRAGSFDQALAAVELLLKSRRGRYPLLALKTVVNPLTLPQLPVLYRLASDLGMEYFNPILENTGTHFERIDFATTLGEVDERLSEVPPLAGLDPQAFIEVLSELKALECSKGSALRFTPQNVPPGDLVAMVRGEFHPDDHACNVFWNALYISAYGDFLACASHHIGSLRHQSLRQIWNGEAVQELRRHRIKKNVLPGCSGCCYLTIRPGRVQRYEKYFPHRV